MDLACVLRHAGMRERHQCRTGISAAEQDRTGRLPAAVRVPHRRHKAKQTVLICGRDLPEGGHVHFVGAAAEDEQGGPVRQGAGGRARGNRAHVRRGRGRSSRAFPTS